MKTLPRWLKNTIKEAEELTIPLPFTRGNRTPAATREGKDQDQRPELKSA